MEQDDTPPFGSDEWVRLNWAGGSSQEPHCRGMIVRAGHAHEYVERGPNGEVLRYWARPKHWDQCQNFKGQLG